MAKIPQLSHWEIDDIYVGTGLAPWVYGLAPLVVLAVVGGGVLLSNRTKTR